MTTLSESLKQNLKETMDKLAATEESFQKEVSSKSAEVEDLRGKLQSANQALQEMQMAHSQAQDNLAQTASASMASQEKLDLEMKRLREQGEAQATQIGVLEQELQAARQQLQEGIELKAKLEAQEETLRSELASATSQCSSLQVDLKACKSHLSDTEGQCRNLKAELSQASAELATVQSASSQRDDRISAAQSLLQSRIDSLQEQLEAKKTEADQAQSRSAELATKLRAAEAQSEELVRAAELRDAEIEGLTAQLAQTSDALHGLEASKLEAEKTCVAQFEEVSKKADRIREAEELAERKQEEAHAAKAAAEEAELRLTKAEEELSSAKATATKAVEEADSHRQLIRALQQQLQGGEEERKKISAERDDLLDKMVDLRSKLEKQAKESKEASGSSALHPSGPKPSQQLEEAKEPSGAGESQLAAQAEDPGKLAVSAVAAGQKAHAEEVSALQERIEFLEKRCSSMQKKLDARPIIFQAGGEDEAASLLEAGGAGATSPAPEAPKSAGQVAKQLVEKGLRTFTQQILRRETLLWAFYLHLLVLYTITGSCISSTTAPSADLDTMMQQKAQKP